MQSAFQNLIHMQAQWLFLHQQDSFDDAELVAELRQYPLHIYLIGKTPVIRLEVSKTLISPRSVSLTFVSNVSGVRKEMTIEMVNDRDIVRIDCPYPHNFVTGFDSTGKEVFLSKASLLLKYLSAQRGLWHNEFELEVLYVGQAFGKNGSRITVDRLKSHDKAQRIYFDTQQKFPDYEVWFVGITFRPLLMTMFKPWGDVDPAKFEDELAEQEAINTTPISFDQRVTLAEASLIRYFNTYRYNKEYLNFPSQEHKSYGEVYALDFNSAGFELSTHSLYIKLFSESVPASFVHCGTYFLQGHTERKSMLKWFE
ncbi:MAG: hypothetical protein EOO13_00020 [Chitinophagaceae bacterium]|nr:MAG: hypothetical protein EOO13_00020 [Chitinophagaceae bacterium]